MRCLTIILLCVAVAATSIYGKDNTTATDCIYKSFATEIQKRDKHSFCVYKQDENGIVCENIINGQKDGFWLYLPTNANPSYCITGQYKKDVMAGEWKVFGPNGIISYTISNISVISDDENFWHNQLNKDDIYMVDDNFWTERFDKNSKIYIGLWTEYNNQSEQTNSYWCIFSDDFEQCSFKIVKSK